MLDPAPHIMIVEGRFYEDIQDELLIGASTVLDSQNITFETFTVPGAFEIPAAICYGARSLEHFSGHRRFDGVIALGCVIRGETTHYDHICEQVSRSLMDLTTRYALALGFGLLTCENRDQAMERAAVNRGNKGAHAAQTCLKMVEHKHHFHLYPR
ncbi:MAG: 6,7-dimethyl-8-ribityllumazine synthase [Rhodospirillaceae bacterium]|nr:6,7-dimethyl-8-ribityllumazine synthase [Rhodospirillaceae bacterium]|tara:strand:- start:161 stop:628 length:468 start_codon:yes stop_codon:yes gene_type:complete